MTTRPADIPRPLDEFDGQYVVASTWLNDDDPEALTALLLTIDHTPGWHYGIREIERRDGEWVVTMRNAYENIVPAVRAYEDNGGDY